MKKVCCMVLVLIMALGCTTALAQDGRTRGGLTYTVANGEITITGYEGVNGDVTIPSEIDGVPVVAIGDSAFRGNKAIENVTISEGITRIDDLAFSGCENLKSITLPDSLTFIGMNTFSWYNDIKTITIPAGVNSMGDNPFYYCERLKEIKISPDNTTYEMMGNFLVDVTTQTVVAYLNTTGKNNMVTIPDGIKGVGGYAFYDKSNVKGVIVPKSVEYIEEKAFYGIPIVVEEGSYAESWAKENDAPHVYADAEY